MFLVLVIALLQLYIDFCMEYPLTCWTHTLIWCAVVSPCKNKSLNTYDNL